MKKDITKEGPRTTVPAAASAPALGVPPFAGNWGSAATSNRASASQRLGEGRRAFVGRRFRVRNRERRACSAAVSEILAEERVGGCRALLLFPPCPLRGERCEARRNSSVAYIVGAAEIIDPPQYRLPSRRSAWRRTIRPALIAFILVCGGASAAIPAPQGHEPLPEMSIRRMSSMSGLADRSKEEWTSRAT
jgi:hypothetical protein